MLLLLISFHCLQAGTAFVWFHRKSSLSKQFAELFFGQAGLANERTKRAFCQLPMIGHGQSATRSVAQDDVAAGLMVHSVTNTAECLDSVRTRTDGKAAHAGISTISSVMPLGIGSPCFFRLSMYPWIASRMLAIASSRVLPCETHPGSAGHSATNTPSSSGSTVTRNFMQMKVTPSQKDASAWRWAPTDGHSAA